MSEWQKIGSEPQDERRVIVGWSDRRGLYNPCIGYRSWTTKHGWHWIFEPDFVSPEPPDIFQPLPMLPPDQNPPPTSTPS